MDVLIKVTMNKFDIKLVDTIQSAPIIYIPHFDYEMVDAELAIVMQQLKMSVDNIAEFDLHSTQVEFSSKIKNNDSSYNECRELTEWLEAIVYSSSFEKYKERVFLFKNFQKEQFESVEIQTLLQTFAAKYKHGDYEKFGQPYCIVIVSPMPVACIPPAVEKIITVVELPNPTFEDIMERIKDLPVVQSVKNLPGEQVFKEQLARTLLGLQMYEVNQILRTLQKRYNSLKSKSLQDALDLKRNIVRKSGIIEILDPDVSFSDVGGLEVLKEDLRKKAVLYNHLREIDDSSIQLPLPKGVLIIGMPGCGKTMIAKAVASEFKVALLRLDVNRLMGQYVGMSEENLRRALQTAETANPCVLWIDEVEKAFAGAGAGGESDMLVQRLMGQFLTWMQERKSAVYIVATANDVMRPEFMRKGRFDEVYFVDFPNEKERKSILEAKLKRYGFLGTKSNSLFDLSEFEKDGKPNENFDKIAALMQGERNGVDKDFQIGFSGAEIESVVTQVMENAYVNYQQAIDAEQKPERPIKITKEVFEEVIEKMKSTIMANQLTTDEDKRKNPNKSTNIERIREMQKTYKFKKATKTN